MASHNALGKAGEEAAALYLLYKGYRIRERNWRHGHDEVDLVIEWPGWLIFVEVKTRRNEAFGKPEEAVNFKKRRNLVAAAAAYIDTHDVFTPVRFDIVSVVGSAPPFQITHFENAFLPDAPHLALK